MNKPDYKKLIIELLEQMSNESELRRIYIILIVMSHEVA